MHFLDGWFPRTLHFFGWIWPLYAISLILNALWYQGIAECMRKFSSKSKQRRNVFIIISEEIHRIIVATLFLLQTSMTYHVPYIGPCLSFLLLSLLYSYYTFDCVWQQRDVSFGDRIQRIEEQWSYYLGFGLPCVLLTFWLPQLISYGVYALLYPLFLISAHIVQAPLKEKTFKMPVFFLAQWMSKHIQNRILL